jgi:hypothetical protein
MRKCASVLCAAFVVGAIISSAAAAEKAPATENAQLKAEVRALRAQMQQMQRRLDEIEARMGAGAKGPQGSTVAGSAAAPATAGGAGVPPPGVTPAGVPLQESAPGAIASAVKQLMPGPVTRPTSRKVSTFANYPGETPQGLITASVPGVPKIFLPDIGVIGDFTFRQSDLRPGDPRYNPADDQFLPRDTQLVFFSPIDPYTNAQVSIDKPYNGPFDIEEAFLVFNRLPWGLTLRAGQFRPRFGLINELDSFQLPMVNRPQALARYIGDDGFVTPGVNVSAYIPNPWEADLKADLNMVSPDSTFAFNHRQGQTFDFAYIGSLIYSREMFTSGSLTGGLSLAGGPGAGGASYLEDPFLQIQYAPDQRHIWTFSTEGLLAERKGVGDHGVKRGFYTLIDYNFWLRYHAGFLLDIVDRPGVARGTEAGFSPILTYFVSDNTRLRLQYTHTTPSGPERAADGVYMQATFSLGNLKPLD